MRGTCQHLFRFASIAFCLILAACSGGGGGGGGDSSAASGSITLSTNNLTFVASNTNSTPPPQTIIATVTGVTSGTLYIKIVSTGLAVASITNITVTGSTSGQGTIYPTSAATLGPGIHTSTITVYACTTDPDCNSGQLAGSPQTVDVTYTITGVAASVSSLSYSIGNSPVAGDFANQFSVTGYPNQNWDVGSNVPWLSVLPTSGNTGSATGITALLDPAQLDALSNGTHSALITISPSSGSPLAIPVTLTIMRTQVNFVVPYIGIVNTAARAIIRGNNFSAVTITGINFGSNNVSCPGPGCSVISDTEIHAIYPALPAGTYPVQLENAEGITRSYANLVIVEPPNFSATTLTYPYTYNSIDTMWVRSVAFDAERRMLVVGMRNILTDASTGLIRYSYSTDWQAPEITSISEPVDTTLSPDGSRWFVLKQPSIVPVDTSNFTIGTAANGPLSGSHFFQNIVATNDGNAILTTGNSSGGNSLAYRYIMPSSGYSSSSPYSALLASGGAFGGALNNPQIGASADGSRVAIILDSFTPPQPVFMYTATSGILSATSLKLNGINRDSVSGSPVLDRNGLRIALISGDTTGNTMTGTNVYDETLASLGALPITTHALIFRPNPIGPAERAYTLDVSVGCRIRAFDLSTTVNGNFPEVTTAPYPISVVCPGKNPKMAITPDGGTLFLASRSGVIVQPVP